MQLIWDNLAAMLIASVVVLMLLVSRERMVEASIEQTANVYVRQQAQSFALWMEEDFTAVGNDLWTGNENPIVAHSDSTYTVITPDGNETVDITNRFVFKKVIRDGSSSIDQWTRYAMQKVEMRRVEQDSIPVFRLTRDTTIVGPNGPYYRTGESSTLVSYLKIDMLDKDGGAFENPETCVKNPPSGGVCDFDDIYNTRVKFAMVTPFDTERETLREVYYGSTLLLPFGD